MVVGLGRILYLRKDFCFDLLVLRGSEFAVVLSVLSNFTSLICQVKRKGMTVLQKIDLT